MTAGPAPKTYSTELRAQVVAALLAGDSERFVAQKFGVGRTTARRWLAAVRAAAGPRALVPVVESAEPQPSIGALLGNLIREQLLALTAQATFFRDPEWLARQNAGDLALLHGIVHDKVFRVIAALQPGEDGPEEVT